MYSLSRFVAYALIALAVISLLVYCGYSSHPQSYPLLGAFFSLLIGAAFFFILAEIIRLLTDISNQLTWLMPPAYWEQHSDPQPTDPPKGD